MYIKIQGRLFMNTYILHPQAYENAFTEVFSKVNNPAKNADFLTSAITTSKLFLHLLHTEHNGEKTIKTREATKKGGEILQLLETLFLLVTPSPANDRLIKMLAVSTGIWIVKKGGTINDLDLLVNAITTFANQTRYLYHREELYEVSLLILMATDERIKADHDKINTQRPWRLLCLNHAVIATRSGNRELVKPAFERLIKYLPNDAEAFFERGIKEVKTGSYPFSVRNIVMAYHNRYNQHQNDDNSMSSMLLN